MEEVNEALRKIPLSLRETVQTITHDLDDSMAQIAMQFRGMYELEEQCEEMENASTVSQSYTAEMVSDYFSPPKFRLIQYTL